MSGLLCPIMPEKKGQQSRGENHREAKKLSHGEVSEEIPNLRIGFLVKFYEEPHHTIKEQEKDNHHPVSKSALAQPPEQEKEDRDLP